MAIPVAGQLLEYFEDQKAFVSSLPFHLQKKVTVRLSQKDWGWNQVERWKEFVPENQLDIGLRDIKKIIKKNRLYISTYNATTFLESLTWNIPTIMFWNEKHWELNDEAKFYFETLEKVGIFHKTPQSAAKKIINIWDNIDNWWNCNETQNAREIFINQYSKNQGDLLKVLENVLLHRN
jgi:putative transferase (TIGR04331 family)